MRAGLFAEIAPISGRQQSLTDDLLGLIISVRVRSTAARTIRPMQVVLQDRSSFACCFDRGLQCVLVVAHASLIFLRLDLLAENIERQVDCPLKFSSSPFFHSASLTGLVELGTATNGQLAKLGRDLIRYSIKFLMTLAVRLIEE